MVESVHTGFFNLFQNLTVLFVSHRQHDHRNVCGEFYSFTVQFAKEKPLRDGKNSHNGVYPGFGRIGWSGLLALNSCAKLP